MTISLGNALKSVKEDSHWLKKVFIGGLIYLVSIIGDAMLETKGVHMAVNSSGFVLYLIFYSILLGFMVSTTNKKINGDFIGWTEWSEPNIFLKGLKCMLCYFVYTLLLSFICCFTIFVIAAVVVLIGYLINMILQLNPQITDIFMIIVGGTAFVVVFLYLIQFFNVGYLYYCKNFKFRDLMAIKKQFMIIADNQHAAWTLVGKIILYTLLLVLVSIIACITLIGIFLLPFICFAFFMALVDLLVQYGKKINTDKYLS